MLLRAMARGGQDRVELPQHHGHEIQRGQDSGCYRYQDNVVDECQEEILPDCVHCLSAYANSLGDTFQASA